MVQSNGVVIPAHTQVQGVVESDERPGHLKRTSEFRFRFTTLIFPNNLVVPINGVLQSIPGARNICTRSNDKTLEPVDQPEKVITPTVASAVGGSIIGSHRAFGIGLLPGAGLGAALGLGAVLLKRGDEINLPQGIKGRNGPGKLLLISAIPGGGERALRSVIQPVNDAPQAAHVDKDVKRRRRHRIRSERSILSSSCSLATTLLNQLSEVHSRACQYRLQKGTRAE